MSPAPAAILKIADDADCTGCRAVQPRLPLSDVLLFAEKSISAIESIMGWNPACLCLPTWSEDVEKGWFNQMSIQCHSGRRRKKQI